MYSSSKHKLHYPQLHHEPASSRPASTSDSQKMHYRYKSPLAGPLFPEKCSIHVDAIAVHHSQRGECERYEELLVYRMVSVVSAGSRAFRRPWRPAGSERGVTLRDTSRRSGAEGMVRGSLVLRSAFSCSPVVGLRRCSLAVVVHGAFYQQRSRLFSPSPLKQRDKRVRMIGESKADCWRNL